MSRALLAAMLAALGVLASWADEKHVWMELIGFDNSSPDYGVAEFLSRSEVRPAAGGGVTVKKVETITSSMLKDDANN